LTATSFGNATGTVGVEVVVAGGVFEGKGVCVGVSVDRGCVDDGVITDSVGVSVTDVLEGRLQASMAKTRTNVANKLRDFMVFLLLSVRLSYAETSKIAIVHRVLLRNP
jgi:hypothetical protein